MTYREELIEMQLLAAQIPNNKAFKKILRDSDPAKRKDVYEALKPHLQFKPAPFWVLNA